jgi:hypothetical protein
MEQKVTNNKLTNSKKYVRHTDAGKLILAKKKLPGTLLNETRVLRMRETWYLALREGTTWET